MSACAATTLAGCGLLLDLDPRSDDGAGARDASAPADGNATALDGALHDGIVANVDAPARACSTDCGWGCPDPALCDVPTFVTAGSGFTCALLTSGRISCWGLDSQGQLGDGVSGGVTARPETTVVGIDDAVYVTAGADHACALRGRAAPRSVWCWGNNAHGQLGDGGFDARAVPAPVTLDEGAKGVAAGLDHTCAILDSGGVRCWGDNDRRALGNASVAGESAVPLLVAGIADATSVAAGSHFTCVRHLDGTVSCWGAGYALGDGIGDDTAVPVLVSGIGDAVVVAAGGAHACAQRGDLSVWCWGNNGAGALGDGTFTASSVPVQALIDEALGVACGSSFTCAPRRVPPGAWCWGDNLAGELGDGSGRANHESPVEVSGTLDASTTWLAGGFLHTAAATSDGLILSWGDDAFGQLGDGTAGGMSDTPVVATPALP